MPRKPTSASAPVPASQASIAALKRQGWTEARIARAIGRDSSLVHQVATGKKPGRNLAASLAALSEGRSAPAPARRTTKAGTAARFRESAKPLHEVRTVRGFISMLDRIAARGGRVIALTTWQNLRRSYDRRTPATARRDAAGNFVIEPFQAKRGTGAGVPAERLLKQFRAFQNRHPDWADKRLLDAFWKSKATVRDDGFSQTASGLVTVSIAADYGPVKR